MLRNNDLVRMRSLAQRALTEPAVVRRAALTPDGAGGHAVAWSVVSTTVGRVAPAGATPRERLIAEREGVESLWNVSLPDAADVRAGDRIEIAGRVFVVVDVLKHTWNVLRLCVCKEL